MECGESPAIGWTSAWISSWTTTSPVATTQIYTHVMKKPGLGVRSSLDR